MGETFEPCFRLAFGEVRHRRLRPVGHFFRYRSFMVSARIDPQGPQRAGNWLLGLNRPALLSMWELDHGPIGGEANWLADLLRDAGIGPTPQIRLLAFPRVLGYAFKPVSFWFCADAQARVLAVVAEVHNTFGERHCYVLRGNGQTDLQAPKRFHVSPFCQVSGAYRFRFFESAQRMLVRIDHHDNDGPLLQTSISGRYGSSSAANVLRALLAYPVLTLGVIARIHLQALLLWLRRVPYFSKPAAPDEFYTHANPR